MTGRTPDRGGANLPAGQCSNKRNPAVTFTPYEVEIIRCFTELVKGMVRQNSQLTAREISDQVQVPAELIGLIMHFWMMKKWEERQTRLKRLSKDRSKQPRELVFKPRLAEEYAIFANLQKRTSAVAAPDALVVSDTTIRPRLGEGDALYADPRNGNGTVNTSVAAALNAPDVAAGSQEEEGNRIPETVDEDALRVGAEMKIACQDAEEN